MRCGLFGKLPAKRDFVAVSAPREFLRLWEPWVEAGMTASRSHLGARDWKAAFNSAPIWRFWLGAELCGKAIAGAIMPSSDALGRLFPLTLIGVAEKAEALVPPDVDARDLWFERVEALLLQTLDARATFEATVAALAGLPAFPCGDCGANNSQHRNKAASAPAAGGVAPSFPAIFACLRLAQRDLPASAATFWWTIGGDACEPLAFICKSMPAPAMFTDMLTVHLRSRPEANSPLG